jgi:hypothetical protein
MKVLANNIGVIAVVIKVLEANFAGKGVKKMI